MAHINAIGAGMFSDLSVAMPSAAVTSATDSKAEFDLLFATAVESVGGAKGAGNYVRVKNVREFPAMGTPPNIVNVPTYGQSTSQQIQGQADAPSMEIQLNSVPADWADGTLLGDAVADGIQYAFRFTMLNSLPPAFNSTPVTGSNIGGTVGSPVQNSMWYWIGKIEAYVTNPQLTDANTATVTLSVQSAFYGAYTITATA